MSGNNKITKRTINLPKEFLARTVVNDASKTQGIFCRTVSPKITRSIFKYFCFQDIVISQFVCSAFYAAAILAKKRMERKFGTIINIGYVIYVSTKKACRPEFMHYFIGRNCMTQKMIVLCKLIIHIGSISFIYKNDRSWNLSLPSSQGNIKTFRHKSLMPARLDHYVCISVIDSGENVAVIILSNSCSFYLYYDSKIVHDKKYVFTKKIRGIIRTVTCEFSEGYTGSMSVLKDPKMILKINAAEMANITFIVDYRNAKALMYSSSNMGKLYFIDSDIVQQVLMSDRYKQRRKCVCMNK